MHTGTICCEGRRSGCLWCDFKTDAVIAKGEAVGQIIHVINVGDIDGDFVALFTVNSSIENVGAEEVM